VKFDLGAQQGLDIFAPAIRNLRKFRAIHALVEGAEPTKSPGGGGLTYDQNPGQYHYNWKTREAVKGTCRQLVIKLKDALPPGELPVPLAGDQRGRTASPAAKQGTERSRAVTAGRVAARSPTPFGVRLPYFSDQHRRSR
jgi:hypothetical protein